MIWVFSKEQIKNNLSFSFQKQLMPSKSRKIGQGHSLIIKRVNRFNPRVMSVASIWFGSFFFFQMQCLNHSMRVLDPNRFHLAFQIWREIYDCRKCSTREVSLLSPLVESFLQFCSFFKDIKDTLYRLDVLALIKI